MNFNKLLIGFVILLLAVGAGFYFWEAKGEEFIEGTIRSKISAIDFPADSFLVDYEGGELTFFNADLNEYLFKGQQSQNVIAASTIKFTGLDWMSINATGDLKADTILVTIDSLRFNYEDIDKINIDQNDLVNKVATDKLLISFGGSHISNAPQIQVIDFSSSHISLDKVSYTVETNSVKYENPIVEVQAESLIHKGRKIYVSKLDYTEQSVEVEGVYYVDKPNNLVIDLVKISLEGDVLTMIEKDIIESVSIYARQLSFPENVDALFEEENSGVAFAKLKIRSDLIELFKENSTEKRLSLRGASADLTNVKMEPRSGKITYDYFDFKASSSKVYEVSEFKVETGMIRLNSARVVINDLTAKSKKSRSQLAVNRHSRNTIYDMSCGKLELEGNTVREFMDSKQLIAEKAVVTDAKLIAYTDMNADVAQGPKQIFSQVFKEFEIPVDIRVVELKNNYVKYDLRALRRTDNGSIHFSNLNGTIDNMTNIPIRLQKDHMIRSRMSGLLMDQGRLEMSMNFNMIDDQNSYDYKGKLVNLEFQDVNRMLVDLSAMRIKKGEFDELLIDVKANTYRSQGRMEFYYKSLKIEYVEERTTGISDPFRLFVNNFVLRQNNRKDRSPKLVKVDVMHDTKHSTFKRVWESVFDGLEKTLLPKVPKVPLLNRR